MGVYIKNWKMPECCGACSLCYSHCAITGSAVEDDTVSEKRLDDCPLYDVQPHGNLVDVDALIALIKRAETELDYTACSTEQIYDTLKATPVVIQADVGDA